jgi:hypothetical protein
MRNGDLYKMQSLLKQGVKLDEIHRRWKNEYAPEHINEFLTPKKKRGRPRKEVSDVGSSDM